MSRASRGDMMAEGPHARRLHSVVRRQSLPLDGGLDNDFAFRYLIYVLIVVSVGGLGSIWGSFAAAVLLGVSDVAGKYYVPQFGAFLIYAVMVGILMWRPHGLFGRR